MSNGTTPTLHSENPDLAGNVEVRIWNRLLQLHGHIYAELNRTLQSLFSLSLAKFDVLAQLHRFGGELSQGELSHHLKVTGGNVTGMVRRLIADDFVSRSMSATDRRSFIISMTPAGQNIFEEAWHAHNAFLKNWLGNMAPEQLEETLKMLDYLVHLPENSPQPYAPQTASTMSASGNKQKSATAAPPASLAELEAQMPYLVNRLANFGIAAQNRALSPCQINTVILRTLSVLHIENGLTVNEISTRTFTDQSTASRMIDNMVTAGLVERQIPATDMRRREIILSDAGRKLLKKSWPLMDAYQAKLTENIAPDDLAACRRVLAQMTENLQVNFS
jgi:DNA-binding MarR family transcriptional regulator